MRPTRAFLRKTALHSALAATVAGFGAPSAATLAPTITNSESLVAKVCGLVNMLLQKSTPSTHPNPGATP